MPGKTKLATALAEPPPHPLSVTVCHVVSQAELLKKKADRTAYFAAVDNPRWSSRLLSAALASQGIAVSHSIINRHRRGDCPCYRKAAQ